MSSSSSSSERSENGEPQGVDEYNGLSGDGNARRVAMEISTTTAASATPPTTTIAAAANSRIEYFAARSPDGATARHARPVSATARSSTFLIESLDDDGYLTARWRRCSPTCPRNSRSTSDEMSAASRAAAQFRPAGRRRAFRVRMPEAAIVAARALAYARARARHRQPLSGLLRRTRFHASAQAALKASDDDLRDAHALIRSLEPFPGAAYGKAEADYVVPDILGAQNRPGGWQAELNPEIVPKLARQPSVRATFCAITGAIRAAVQLRQQASGSALADQEYPAEV